MRPSDALGQRARTAFLRACRLDVESIKPGNVSVTSPGHGMTAAQFIASAEAAAPALFAPGSSVGARILDAVTRTQAVAGCNTNLGILLLVAPLAAALDRLDDAAPVSAGRWHEALSEVLAALGIDDTRDAYRAIALANPGGLGDAPEQSVHDEPSVDLRAAMQLAADRDSIARQYASDFADIFAEAERLVQASPDRPPEAAMLDVFLTFLRTFPDSHILRKHGVSLAQSVTRHAAPIHDEWRRSPPADALAAIETWDAELKAHGVNPGTSADLSVAAVFVVAVLMPERFACADAAR